MLRLFTDVYNSLAHHHSCQHCLQHVYVYVHAFRCVCVCVCTCIQQQLNIDMFGYFHCLFYVLGQINKYYMMYKWQLETLAIFQQTPRLYVTRYSPRVIWHRQTVLMIRESELRSQHSKQEGSLHVHEQHTNRVIGLAIIFWLYASSQMI